MASFVDDSPVGTAGTLIGAALETAGHFIQSQLLDLLSSSAGTSIAGLLFLIAGVSAILIVAIGGNYKFGAWFLVGPVLFYAVVFTRVESSGAIWQFGSRLHKNEYVDQAVAGIVDSGKKAKVSWFFAKWNKLVSMSIRSMTEVVGATKQNADLNFINQTMRYVAINSVQVSDPKIQEFMRLLTFSADCLPFYEAQFRVNAKDTSATVDQEALKREIAALGKRRISTESSRNAQLVKELRAKGYFEGAVGVDASKNEFTCEELWKLTIPVVKRTAIDYLSYSITTQLEDGQTAAIIIKDLEKKFEDTRDQNERAVYLLHAIMGKILFNTLIDIKPEMQRYYSKSTISSYGEDNTFTAGVSDGTYTEKYNDPIRVQELLTVFTATSVAARKGEFLNFMQGLPYLQGIGLYFLAMTFPFFALALVIPGRHHSFLLWMSLWVWLKLWDLGLAIVMRIDQMLFRLLPSGPAITATDLGTAESVFKLISGTDPTHSVYMYYHIMATLLAAIPLITGILVKKASGEVVNAISQGYRDFAGHMGESLQSYTAGLISFQKIKEAESHILERGKQAYDGALTDSRVMTAVGLWGASKVANENLVNGLHRGGSAVFTQASHAMNEAAIGRNKELAGSIVRARAAVAMERAAQSEKVGRLIRHSVLTGWASHSRIDDHYATQFLADARFVEDNYQFSGSVSNLWNRGKGPGFKGAGRLVDKGLNHRASDFGRQLTNNVSNKVITKRLASQGP